MKLSAIEIGTNSTKMIVVEPKNDNSFITLQKKSTVNRLSKKMFERNIITSESMENSLGIINEFISEIKDNNAELVSVFSTSVMRDAYNRDDFIQKVKESCGYEINVISGILEAFYAFNASSCLIKNSNEKFAVIDIGGGSTEIIYGNTKCIDKKTSIDIGAVRLTEMFIKSDPITDDEINLVSEYIKEKLKELSELSLIKKNSLIGTGGTIKTLATISTGSDYRDEQSINGLVISKEAVRDIFKTLIKKDIECRKKIQGLNPKRADVIIAGFIILLNIMDTFEIDEITISSQGVIEGFMLEHINKNIRGIL